MSIAAASCDGQVHDQGTHVAESAQLNKRSENNVGLIDRNLTMHQFGAVVGRTGLQLTHAYRLTNKSDHDVRIIGLENRRPCCGEARIGKTLLHPDETTDVEVTLSVRQEFGKLIHDAVVLTEPSQDEELILRTIVDVYPPVRIEETEEMTQWKRSAILSTDKPIEAAFRVLAYGTSAEPPVDQNRLELHSTISVGWHGAKQQSRTDDGLAVVTRRFVAKLDPGGQPGQHRAEIALTKEKRDVCSHLISWETVPPISVTPQLVAINTDQQTTRVIMQSRDRTVFRITRIRCQHAGIQARTAESTPGLSQIVEIQTDRTRIRNSKSGKLIIFTDHPAEATVELPFVVID